MNRAPHDNQAYPNRQKDIIESDLENTKESLERIGAGKPPLSPGYPILASQLRHHGINARHACDLVDISDKRWQSTIESYLANNIEAIVVDETDERRAFEVHRGLPVSRDIYGLKIVRGSRQLIRLKPRWGTLRYLDDLGLQVFMASPGENQAILNAFLHRYYDIMKDPDLNVVYVEGHDILEKVRDICRSDLLEFHPELVDEELMASAYA